MRTTANSALSILAVALFAGAMKRWELGHWPDAAFYISFAVVAAVFPLTVWALFVPAFIELTDDSFTIARPLCRPLRIPVDDLEYYGQSVAYFRIQLRGHTPFRVYTLGFPRREWRRFVRELETRFPERYASVWAL